MAHGNNNESVRQIGNVRVAEGDFYDFADIIDREGASGFRRTANECKLPYSSEDVEAIIAYTENWLDKEEEAGR